MLYCWFNNSFAFHLQVKHLFWQDYCIKANQKRLDFTLISEAVIDLLKVFTQIEKRYTNVVPTFPPNNSNFTSI